MATMNDASLTAKPHKPAGVSRRERRELRRESKLWPASLTKVPPDTWPTWARLPDTVAVMRSRDFIVRIASNDSSLALAVMRTELDQNTRRHKAGISWDELQRLKREAGYGDWYAVEVFPPDARTFNETNMRHLWLLPASGLVFGKLIGIN